MTSVFLDNTKRHIRNKHCIKKREENSYYVIQPRKLSTNTIFTILNREDIQSPKLLKHTIVTIPDPENTVALDEKISNVELPTDQSKQQLELLQIILNNKRSFTTECKSFDGC